MRKKITMLLASLFLCMGAWAQTSLRVSEGLLTTQENGQYKWTSEKITAPAEGLKKLRVTFLRTSNNEKPAGFPCVAIAEFYLYDKEGNPVELTADKFSSNATQSGEGSIEAICDGNISDVDDDGDDYDWYWHSQWSGTSAPYGYHYLEVDVTSVEEADLSEFSIGWVTRRSQASPAEVVISTGATTEEAAMNANTQMLPKVSTDVVHVYTIKSVRAKNYLTYSEESAKPVRNSSVTENGYWYFTEGTDGKVQMHNLASGKVLGTNYEMAEEGEWYISPAVYRPGVVFSKTEDITTENCIDDQNGSIGDWKHVASDNEGTTWLVELADVEVPMLSLKNKKIAEIGAPTTTVESGQWYILNNVGRGNYVSQEGNNWKMRATSNLAENQSAEEKAGYLFKITKNGEYYNIISGNGKYFKLGSNTASTSASPVNFEIALIGESTDNFYLLDKDNGYAADGQPSGSNFVGWSSSAPTSAGGNDSYKLLPVVLAERNATDDLSTLIAEIEAMGIEGSDNIGYYSIASVNALNDAIATAKNIEEATEDDVETLQAALDGLKVVLPEAGKFYRFSYDFGDAGVKYIQAVASGVTSKANAMLMNEEQGAASIFYYADDKLLSYSTGLYVNDKGGNRGLQAVGADAGAVRFEASTVLGKLYIYAGDSFHANTASDVYFVDHCSAPHAPQHNFTIEEVTTLPVAVSAAGYATLYAPVALTIPAEGVTVYTATVEDGYLALTEVEGAIPANTGVIIEAAEGTYNFAVAAEAADVESYLVGAYAKSEKNAYAKVYTLQKPTDKEVGFYLFNGQDTNENKTYINGFRAWVEVPNGEAAPAMFSLGRGEGTTAIDSVELTTGNVVIYDLAGRRVEKMEKGIYIVNGKKVIR